ncbi:MAG TPA: glycoside hydrolase family 3 N-terminal domain-containing protein [Thermoleophilaceae bacterium]|nr:glycoside hydrolase family 3 N-terminal domain-containing protein [Thermoleophilaceae bacterium]
MRRRLPIVGLVLVLLVGAGVAAWLVFGRGGGGGSKHSLPEASGSAAGGPLSQRSFLERVIPPPPERTTGPAVPRNLTDLARRLPLERKVAELFLYGFSGTDQSAPVFDDLAKLDIGGLVITADNYKDPPQLSQLTSFAATVARRHHHVPPWLLTVQDGGEFNELSGVPPADAPSNIKSVTDAATEAAQAASALRQMGIDGVLGPDADVDTSTGGAYTRVAFSDDPAQVARYVGVTVKEFAHDKMLTAPKHFPGLGAADQPTDDGAANVGLSPQQLAVRDLVPFKAAFASGAQAVLVGHGLYSTDEFVTPASESSALMVGLLRQNMHFGGIAITDDLESPAITGFQSVPDAAVAAVKAGADMVWISGPSSDQTAAYSAVLSAARSGQIPAARIEQAVLRILEVKQRLGLISGG